MCVTVCAQSKLLLLLLLTVTKGDRLEEKKEIEDTVTTHTHTNHIHDTGPDYCVTPDSAGEGEKEKSKIRNQK